MNMSLWGFWGIFESLVDTTQINHVEFLENEPTTPQIWRSSRPPRAHEDKKQRRNDIAHNQEWRNLMPEIRARRSVQRRPRSCACTRPRPVTSGLSCESRPAVGPSRKGGRNFMARSNPHSLSQRWRQSLNKLNKISILKWEDNKPCLSRTPPLLSPPHPPPCPGPPRPRLRTQRMDAAATAPIHYIYIDPPN